MVATNSKMRALGTAMPQFSLPDTRLKEEISNSDFQSQAVLVMFICNHCPFVIHIIETLIKIANDFVAQGGGVIAISSNDIKNYPQDAPDKMREIAREYQFDFPYCYDETQMVAKQFDAACTPDFFIFDQQHKLVYRGQFDDARPKNDIRVSGIDLNTALQAVLKNEKINPQQKPSIGCNIKWKVDTMSQ